MSCPAVPRLLPLCLALLVLSPASEAYADPSIDVATKASQMNQEECANVHNVSKQQVSALGMQKVVEVWAEVGQVYEREGKAPYLLFWRGVLAQCLGRHELAVLDLESFVATQKGQTMFADLVRQSKTRLKRLGGRAKAGEGPAAIWLRKSDVFEMEISYGVATGLRGLACTDEGGRLSETGIAADSRPANASCIGGAGFQFPSGDTKVAPMEGVAPPFWPVGLRLGLGAFPLRFLGLGAVLVLDESLQSTELEPYKPGPVLQFQVGPRLRLLSSVSSGRRAGELRITPSFSVAWGQASPWAGYKDLSEFGYLNAGRLSTRHLGVSLEVGGKLEVSPRAVLSVSGQFVYYLPAGSDAVGISSPAQSVPERWGPYTCDTDEDNDTINECNFVDVQVGIAGGAKLQRAERLYVGGRAAVLLPHPKANLAVGPFFEIAFHSSHLVYPNSSDDEWDAREVEVKRTSAPGKPSELLLHAYRQSSGDLYVRKVYSTRRQNLLFRVGIELQFGAGALGKRK